MKIWVYMSKKSAQNRQVTLGDLGAWFRRWPEGSLYPTGSQDRSAVMRFFGYGNSMDYLQDSTTV
jgi:hypothetical protein